MSASYQFPEGVPVNPRQPVPSGEAIISIFGYYPNRAFAIVALVTFCIAVIAQGYHFVRFRGTRTFSGLMAFGALCEVVGYAARLTATSNPFVVNKFVIQYFFIVVAPVFFQAAFYVSFAFALGRLEHGGKTLLGFNPKILVITMITADVVTTIIQIIGAALIGVAESSSYRDGESSTITSDQANNILLAGLSLQTASFLAFLILLTVCVLRSRKTTSESRLPMKFVTVLFLASLLVFLRTIFRLAETAEGVFSYASRTESLFAGLEYLPVILAVLLFVAFPLHKLLPAPKAPITAADYDGEGRRSSSRSPAGSDLAAKGYLPTTGQPWELRVFDSADSKDQRSSPVARSYVSMRSNGPRIAIAQNGTRVLARKSATERRLVERARKDKNRFGVGAQDSSEFEMIPTLDEYFSQWAERSPEANVDSTRNRHPNGLRRRSVTWTPQRLDHFSLSGYLPPSLRPSFDPSSAAPNAIGAFASPTGPGSLLPEGDPSSAGCSGDGAQGQGSSESAEMLLQRRRPDHAKDPSFGTDLFQALGLDGGSRSMTPAAPFHHIAQPSGFYAHGGTLATSDLTGESPGSVSRGPLTDLPSRKAPDRPARPGVGDIVDFSERSTEPSRKQASELSQHSMLSLSRWEAYGQVQDALQHLPLGHHGEPVETLLNDVDEAGLVSPRRKNSVPWFATNAQSDSIGPDDNGDSESEIEAARLQEQRSAERMFEHARRPISWLPRQSSSGTLPGIASLVEKLEISNPDERSQRGASASSADVTQEVLVHAR